MPQMTPQYSSFFTPQPVEQQQYQAVSSPTSPGNPFLKSAKSQMFSPVNSVNSNPFAQSQPQQPSQQFSQHQQSQFQPQQQQQQLPYQTQQTTNPYLMQQHISPTQPQNPYLNQQQSYQQAPSNFDKNSILALYNYPQLAPQRSDAVQSPPTLAPVPAPTGHTPGSMNPFAPNQTQSPQGQQQPASQSGGPAVRAPGARHISNESVDFAGLMGGRHSPDAFSGLSSSFRR